MMRNNSKRTDSEYLVPHPSRSVTLCPTKHTSSCFYWHCNAMLKVFVYIFLSCCMIVFLESRRRKFLNVLYFVFMWLAAASGSQQTLAKLLPKWRWCPPETLEKEAGEGWETGMFPISRKEKSDDTSNTSLWFLSPLGFRLLLRSFPPTHYSFCEGHPWPESLHLTFF